MANLQQFDQLKANITLKVQPSFSLAVKDDETMKQAQFAGKEIKFFLKQIEDTRKTLTEPLRHQIEEINLYAKSIAEPLLKGETHLKKELSMHAIVLETKRKAEQAEIERQRKEKEAEITAKAKEDAERAEMEAMFGIKDGKTLKREEITAKAERERELVEAQSQARAEMKVSESQKVSGARKIWKFEITDASLVPREYLVVDEKKIRAAVILGTEENPVQIPGVRAFQEISVALR